VTTALAGPVTDGQTIIVTGGSTGGTTTTSTTTATSSTTLVTLTSHELGSGSEYELKFDQSAGQRFKVGADGKVTQLQLLLRQSGTASGKTLTATIRTSWSGTPIATGTLSSNNVGSGYQWLTFDLGAGASLKAGTQYIIRLDYTDQKVHWQRGSTFYSGGGSIEKGSSVNDKFFQFRVRGTTN
jgi:hypothetical protein